MEIRNSRGEPVVADQMPATQVKNQFGRVLDTVLQHGFVVVTKHDAPTAVVVSMAEFTALTQQSRPDLDALSAEFDASLAAMQSSGAALTSAFEASPAKLGKAAANARKRG